MSQLHRGQHPEDVRLFAADQRDRLRSAVADLSFLMTRHYADDAALKLVGDHYQLHARQRKALLRVACSDASLDQRLKSRVDCTLLTGQSVQVDGYNLLITVESALAGGILLRGRDGCIRDIASVHGSYHRVEETTYAVRVIGETFHKLGVAGVRWLFDAPVSNSGRLKLLLTEMAREKDWDWEIVLADQVDHRLIQSHDIVVTSDGWILDRAERSSEVTTYILKTASITTPIIVLV